MKITDIDAVKEAIASARMEGLEVDEDFIQSLFNAVKEGKTTDELRTELNNSIKAEWPELESKRHNK